MSEFLTPAGNYKNMPNINKWIYNPNLKRSNLALKLFGGRATMLIFEPVKIGTMELKNRICMPAIHHCFTPDGTVNERLIKYYQTRAEGGAALITVGGCAIDRIGGRHRAPGTHRTAQIHHRRRLANPLGRMKHESRHLGRLGRRIRRRDGRAP